MGVNIVAINMKWLLKYLYENVEFLHRNYICVSNVHTTVISFEKPDYCAVQNCGIMAIPDGGPLSTVGRKREYKNFVVIAAPTNYDSQSQHLDTSAIDEVMEVNPDAIMIIKSTIPIGYMVSVREETGSKNIIIGSEILREIKALYDNLFLSRIIVGTDMED